MFSVTLGIVFYPELDVQQIFIDLTWNPAVSFILPGLQLSHLKFKGLCYVIVNVSPVKKICDSVTVYGRPDDLFFKDQNC